MEYAETCIFHGNVSRSLLANISELNAIWNVWRPLRYRQVEWIADQVDEERISPPTGSGYLFAFSGGVDASATLLRHSDGSLGWRRLPIGSAVLVHGFDIPHADSAGFDRALVKAKRITASLGVPLTTVRTNIKELPVNWEDAFAVDVASILHVFNEVYDGGVFASCEPYRFPILPWGSNPVSNPFLGIRSYPIRTDGAELSRLEKIKLIARNKAVVDNIRVCWEGKVAGNNCGTCEKCVRTQLELAVVGIEQHDNFELVLSPGMILGIRPPNEIQLTYYMEILAIAESNHLSVWWVDELRTVVRGRAHEPDDEQIAILKNNLVETNEKLNVVLNSTSWKVCNIITRIFRILLPSNSLRNRCFRLIVKPILKSIYHFLRWCGHGCS
jgi:hypothetical protein